MPHVDVWWLKDSIEEHVMVEITDFKNAMSFLTGAVNVVTTAGASGQYGFTASSVCSVTDTPPTLLVCMNQAASSHVHFMDNQVLAVNVLSAKQQYLSQVFSSQLTPQERFEHGVWGELETKSPVLDEALVSFDCQIEQAQTVGTHTIFICRIVAIQQGEANHGLVYFNRAYHHVGQTQVA